MSRVYLSESCRRALTDAVEAACAELQDRQNAPIVAVDEHPQPDTRALVRECVDDIVSAFLRSRNEAASSFACRLPAEVLCSAFSYLDLADRITVTHVCQAWRDVSLAAPAQLWSAISVGPRPGTLADRLARSGSVPLQLHICVHPNNATEVFSCLTLAWDRLQTLFLRLDKRLKRAHTDALSALLSKAVPSLTAFTLVDPAARLAHSNWPYLFDGSPSLRVLKLDLRRKALAITRSFDTVTHLTLRVEIGSPRLLTWIFASFPCLVALVVEPYNRLQADASGMHQHPDTLRSFFVRLNHAVTDARVALILQHINHTSIPTVGVDYDNDQDPGPTAESIGALVSLLAPMQHIYSANIQSLGGGLLDAITHHSLGRRRIYRGIRLSVLRVATLFDHLISLSMNEMMWSVDQPLPETPVLRNLQVYTRYPWSHLSPEWTSGLLSDDETHCVLACPSLRHVAFTAREHLLEDVANYPKRLAMRGLPIVVAPAAIVRFLCSRLRYSTRLQTIAFRGVELATQITSDVAELLEMTDELVCDPLRPADDSCLGLDLCDLLDIEFHEIFQHRDPTRDLEDSQSDDASVASDNQ